MRNLFLCILLLGICGCDTLRDPVTANVGAQAAFEYGGYCSTPPDKTRSAVSYADSGFAYVEQQCGVFFDKLAEVTQAGRFTHSALDASNLGTQSILQAAKVAAEKVTMVGSAITLSEAVFDAFVQQYAFTPYLYKIKELTFQAFDKHRQDNVAKLQQLKAGFLSDDYCDAVVLIQQHARICTISSIQALFDQQVANATTVTTPADKAKGNKPGTGAANAGSPGATQPAAFTPRATNSGAYILPRAPNYTVQ
jgi:hypothetical protein